MLLIYTHSLNTSFKHFPKKVLANSKRSAIIGNINQRLLNNTNSENKSKLVLTKSEKIDIIIAQVKTKAKR